MFYDVAEVVRDLLGEVAEGDGVVVGGFEFGEEFGDVSDGFRFAGDEATGWERVLGRMDIIVLYCC